MPTHTIDSTAQRAILQESVKTVAKLEAFPRPLTTAALYKIDYKAVNATSGELLEAKKQVHHMEDRLRLILIGGTTVTLLGLMAMALPLSLWVSGATFSSGLGILGGATLLGQQTGIFKNGKQLRGVSKRFLNELNPHKAPTPPEDEFQSPTANMMLKDSFGARLHKKRPLPASDPTLPPRPKTPRARG